MGYVFDIILVAVLVFSIINGARKGMAATLYSVVAIVISLILAQVLSPYVTEYLEKTDLEKNLSAKSTENIVKFYENNSDKLISLDQIVNDLNVPDAIKKPISEKLDMAKEDTIAENSAKLGSEVAHILVTLISFIIVALGIALVLFVVGLLLKLIVSLPVISSIDKFGGIVVGVLRGLALIYLFCIVLYLLNIYAGTSSTAEFANTSVLMKLVDKIGLLGFINLK